MQYPSTRSKFPDKQALTGVRTVDDFQRLLALSPETAWDIFADTFHERLVSYAWSMTREHELANDLAQETLLRWFRVFRDSPQSLTPGQPIFPWLAKTCHRLRIDHSRRNQYSIAISTEVHSEDTLTDDYEKYLFFLEFDDCMKDLPDPNQALLNDWFQGTSIRELVVKMGIARGTIGRDILKHRKMVVDCLEGKGWTYDDTKRAFS